MIHKNQEKPIEMKKSDQSSNCGVGVLINLSNEKSHDLIEEGLEVLENLDHRGARGAEEKTGDGAGILIQKPHKFFQSKIPKIQDLDFDSYGVGQVFFPDEKQQQIKDLIEKIANEKQIDIITWRNVPTDNSDLGKTALESEPNVKQFFVKPQKDLTPEKLDKKLYVLRKAIENKIEENHSFLRFYICSLDRRKIVYKGLLTNFQVRKYYPDLSNEKFKSAIVLVHSRFSTNTLGAWELAHPYRGIIHNGEVNTLRGNLNWMDARESDLESEIFKDEIEDIKPVTKEDQSDTAILDNILELLVEGGKEPEHALRMLIPEPWEKNQNMNEMRRDWYDYHSSILEPWDGPLLVTYTDGSKVAAILDRNGFRPCRYYVTKDEKLVMASETGVLEEDPNNIKLKERLQPGQMFLADPEKGRIIPDEEVFDYLTDEKYKKWLKENRVKLKDLKNPQTEKVKQPTKENLKNQQVAFGYTLEHIRRLIKPMSEDSKDPVGAMGNDTPPSVLSDRNKTLFTYFKQHFAQVTNPPLDYIREEIVTSLESKIGKQENILKETPEHCRQLSLESPILTNNEIETIKQIDKNGIKSYTVDITYKEEKTLEKAIEEIRKETVNAIEQGYEIIVLSDRNISNNKVPIPSLLAISGVHHHLIRNGLRTDAGLVLESGQPCAVHHFCTLIGYGAEAINPYLAYDSIMDMVDNGDIEVDNIKEAKSRYIHAIEDGILKVMSKMGISTLESYKGAQIFEALGLDSDFVEDYFYGTTTKTEGIDIEDIERDLLERHSNAFKKQKINGNLDLDQGGELYWRREGEFHQWNPHTIGLLQKAVKIDSYQIYKDFAENINQQEERLQTIRGLLDFDIDQQQSIPLDEVEPPEKIFERFFTASMSFGSLSKEAHETLAEAMNEIGGKAGSGEGGEPKERFNTKKECKNKQVASGRFGVTNNYLSNANHLEIKMAQGSKPGEGGDLPGEKVSETIAKVRCTTPGVRLISPPPHHDIYSIEDLAQLIHDLKCSNTEADIHVKLVSESGIGTIAAGVSKAKADALLISGQSGGTGASPKTSIKSAGLPWELGLTEANQVLLENNLRSRIRLRVDGGLKTGRDIAIAALLGAEEYGFGTAALICVGCIMLRKCHCNTCSVGVATQDPELREKFPGKSDHVVNYMRFLAQEVREIMAKLGFRTMDEMIGRTDKLVQKDIEHKKAKKVDLSEILYKPDSDDDRVKNQEQNHKLNQKIDYDLIEKVRPALDRENPVEIDMEITNRNRTFGTIVSSKIAEKYGEDGLSDDTIYINLKGSGGQSFGAFLAPGITLNLDGDTNDYTGKGLSGGKIIVKTPESAGYTADNNIVIGNVALYGATDGEAYFNGNAGERFAVRNSGAKAVVEGVGDHGCEYMTGGIVVVLGETGKNFGAGMSGGEAYIYDENDDFEKNLNKDMVQIQNLKKRDIKVVKRMVENHYRYTDSKKAEKILDNWDPDKFVKVMPNAYKEVVEKHLKQGEDIRDSPPPSPQYATDGGK